ncbi:MAG: D-2-hydroxyacid dehydrogenase [Blastocatellia bacterium]|nr:D-2-hydroxyacid dehydrogenase [Blastocatellia bacterium]
MEHIVYLDREAIQRPIPVPNFAHDWVEYPNTPPELVLERLRPATIALTNKVRIRSEVIAQLPLLRFICVTATGTDCVDLAACRERSIMVSNVQNWCSIPVAEHTLALIFTLRRQLIALREQVQAGAWHRAGNYCVYPPTHPPNLFGSTLGIIGHGTLGQRVAALGQGLGMKVLLAERKNAETIRPGRVSFERVLAESDVISLHCPLTPQTRHVIAASELALMKPSALLINTARGGLVDPQALVTALQNHTIGGAGIDVLEVEPPVDSNPLLDVTLPNLLVTPHIAWLSAESLETMVLQITNNLEHFIAGNPTNVVA